MAMEKEAQYSLVQLMETGIPQPMDANDERLLYDGFKGIKYAQKNSFTPSTPCQTHL